MKDCGEDLLVDISEILFNELAFYKLMQELDGYVYVHYIAIIIELFTLIYCIAFT